MLTRIINKEKLKKLYSNNGFFVIPKLFKQVDLEKITEELLNVKTVIRYNDKKKILRRIEKIYDKSETLISIHQELLKVLEYLFSSKFTLFKDKINLKPPGGEGFFCHYDGIFHFKDKNNVLRNGWYYYASNFFNILVAIDESNKENGTIEIANSHKGSFESLLENTYKDGTPNLKVDVEKKLEFKVIDLNPGDVLIFKNTCPHRSAKNNGKNQRRSLYYTYNYLKDGSHYDKYFLEKNESKNTTNKSLEGES